MSLAPDRDFTIVICFEDAAHDRFLVARHAKRGWELPGGWVEPHENPLEGGVREFAEETGHLLKGARLVLRQPRAVNVCWVVSGTMGAPVADYARPPAEKIRETRFVRALTDVSPLAFPDDPYEAIGAAVGRKLL